MSRRRSEKRKKKIRRRHIPSRHLLEETSVKQIRQLKLLGRAYSRLQWDYYSELAYHRSVVIERLKSALMLAVDGDYEFNKWQRIVKIKYSLQPLSVAGSLKVDPGGRFNFGDIDPNRYPPFPALYVAKDRSTALQEALGVDSDATDTLAAALAKPDSIACFSISGKLERVIDLNNPDKLQAFVDVISTFKVSDHLRKRAQALRATLPSLITNVDDLVNAVLSKNWRFDSMAADIPAPSQIFGQLVAVSGISGILYPSKFNSVQCLAVFPQNFEDSLCFVQLDDQTPPELTIPRLDGEIWKKNWAELCGLSGGGSPGGTI